MNKSAIVKKAILEKYNSIHDFAKQIDIPCSTIQGALQKEDGITKMSADRYIKICDAVDLDPRTLTPNENSDLNPDEKSLVNIYRSLDDFSKRSIRSMAEMELERKHTYS